MCGLLSSRSKTHQEATSGNLFAWHRYSTSRVQLEIKNSDDTCSAYHIGSDYIVVGP